MSVKTNCKPPVYEPVAELNQGGFLASQIESVQPITKSEYLRRREMKMDIKKEVEMMIGRKIPNRLNVDWMTVGMLREELGKSALDDVVDAINKELALGFEEDEDEELS